MAECIVKECRLEASMGNACVEHGAMFERVRLAMKKPGPKPGGVVTKTTVLPTPRKRFAAPGTGRKIAVWLAEQDKRCSLSEVAAAFDVSERTIGRCIAMARREGVTIHKHGPHGVSAPMPEPQGTAEAAPAEAA